MISFLTRLCLVIFFCGVSMIVLGQTWFSAGYLVDNSGDTLHGFLSEGSFRKSSMSVVYKPDLDGKEEKTFRPGEIRAYGIEPGKLYRTMALQNGQWSFAQEEGTEVFFDTVFAAVVIAGETNVYSYNDIRGYNHVYFDHEGTVLELVESIPLEFQGKSGLFATREVLHSIFADCDSLEGRIEAAALKPKAQQDLFAGYAECRDGAPADFLFEFDHGIVRPLIIVGGNLANCKFKYEGVNALGGVKLNYRLGFAAGMGLEIGSSSRSARWSFEVDALVQYLRSDGARNGYKQAIVFVSDYEWELSGLAVKFPALVRFRLPFRRLQPFLKVGGSFGSWLKLEMFQTKTAVFPSNSNGPETKPVWSNQKDIRRLEQSLIAGLGVGLGRFSLEMRYERGNGFLWPAGWSSTTQSWQLLTAARF